MESNTSKVDLQEELATVVGKASKQGIADFAKRLKAVEQAAGENTSLTTQQDEAAKLLASANLTLEEVCVYVDCTMNQLRSWQDLEAFQTRLAHHIRVSLIHMAPMGPKVLRDILLKGDNKDKLSAVRLLLGVVKLEGLDGEGADLEADLDVLEARGSVLDEGGLQ